GQRTTRVPLRRQLGAFTIGFLTFLSAFFPLWTLAGILNVIVGKISPGPALLVIMGLSMLVTFFVVRRFGSPHVVVGNDGIRVRGTWIQSFIPYEDIAQVGRGLWSVLLTLKNGERRELPIIAIDSDRIDGLIDRIKRGSSGGAGGEGLVTDALARAGKPL